ASAGGAGAVHLWDAASGKQLREIKIEDGWTYGVAISPDGKLLATASGDAHVELWEVATGNRLQGWNANKPRAVAFSPDGKLLAASGEGSIHLWATATGEKLREWKSDELRGETLAF